MNNMSDFIRKMEQVPEKGLQSPQQMNQIKEHREQLSKSGNSFTNHMRAYDEMVNGKPQKTIQTEQVLQENDVTKLIGALQVVKELLDCNLTENTMEIASKVKTIISKI
jgi:hypothetical protein